MHTHIIVLERLDWMTCEMRHNLRSQKLIDVTGSCYSIASPRAKILEDNWTKFHVESDATPYHDAWTAWSVNICGIGSPELLKLHDRLLGHISNQ
jgi:hypothetical protein